VTICGIDPGLKGAIAALTGTNSATFRMPLAGKELDGAVIRDLIANADLIVVEKVHSMPKQGVASTFTFGMGYGYILGICAAMGKRVELVPPQTWKAKILAGTDKSKDAAKAYVARAYPTQAKRTEGECEALCIAEYGRRFLAMEDAA
jgi:crossover junction endodeoxyribonuclease RuvC